jgi:hypothetical protein
VVATNAVGAADGLDQTFTTTRPESVIPPLKCKAGFVKRHGKCVTKHHTKRHKRGDSHG